MKYLLLIFLTIVVTVTIMKVLNIFLKKEVKKQKILREKRHFKMWGYGYFTKEMEDKTIEFWAYHVEPNSTPYFNFTEMKLGVWENDEFTPTEDYRKLPYRLQRGGERLRRKMLGIDGGWDEA